MSHGNNTTRVLASILASVPDAIRRQGEEQERMRLAMRRESDRIRRERGPQPTANPWGIRSVPTRDSLMRVVEPWRAKFVTGAPNTSAAAHQVRKWLLAIRRSPGLRPTDARPLDALVAMNREIAAYGVETITLRSGEIVHYVNLGDPYDTTLLLIEKAGRMRFAVGSWGDLVERKGGAA